VPFVAMCNCVDRGALVAGTNADAEAIDAAMIQKVVFIVVYIMI